MRSVGCGSPRIEAPVAFQEIALVEDEQARCLVRAEALEDAFDGRDLLGMIRIRCVHHVEEQSGVRELLERGTEGIHQRLRQRPDESHRVGDDHLAITREAQPAAGRVERGEVRVLRRGEALLLESGGPCCTT